jgi:hypothetical protein
MMSPRMYVSRRILKDVNANEIGITNFAKQNMKYTNLVQKFELWCFSKTKSITQI